MDQRELKILEGIEKSLNEIVLFIKTIAGILFFGLLVYLSSFLNSF